MLGDDLSGNSERLSPVPSASRTRAPTMPWASRKGNALADQRVGDVNGGDRLVCGGRSHRRSNVRPGEQAGRNFERDLERVGGVEQGLLVFLHVLRIGHRQRMQGTGNG